MRQVGPVLFVDAPEEQRPWAVRQQGDPPGERGHVVEVRVPRGDQVLQQLLGPLPHGSQRSQRVVEGGLLGGDLGIGRGSGHAHRGPTLRQNTRKSARAKVPGHSGDSTPFRPLEQALQLVFRLLVRLDFEPLTEGPYCPSLYSIQASEAIPFLNLSDGKRVPHALAALGDPPGHADCPSRHRSALRRALDRIGARSAAPGELRRSRRKSLAGPEGHGSVGVAGRPGVTAGHPSVRTDGDPTASRDSTSVQFRPNAGRVTGRLLSVAVCRCRTGGAVSRRAARRVTAPRNSAVT